MIVQDVQDRLEGDVRRELPLAKQLTDGTYMQLGVYDTGLSMDSTTVTMKTIQKGARVRWSIDLGRVPYAPFWYNGWGVHKKPRPVFQIAALTWAQDIGLGVETSKAEVNKRALNYGSQFQ